MRKVYSECFVFRGVFRKNIREIQKVYSQPHDNWSTIGIQDWKRDGNLLSCYRTLVAPYVVYQYKLTPRQPYSTDIDPCDFWLSPRLKEHLRSQTFSNLREIPRACQDFFKTFKPNDFAKGYKR